VAKVNQQTKERDWVYRLPKEAEWEYACRGGATSNKFDYAFDFYFEKPTNTLLPEQANFEYGKGLKRTCKVGSYKPNRLGLYDMHGNVLEWCDDAEKTADGASLRVRRGGSWGNASGGCRAAGRIAAPPSDRIDRLGLRVARVPVGAGAK
jgi:formylglycine-generating enzyme required for sulfatase activity